MGGSGWDCLWQAGAGLGKLSLHNPACDSEDLLGSNHPWKVLNVLGTELRGLDKISKNSEPLFVIFYYYLLVF